MKPLAAVRRARRVVRDDGPRELARRVRNKATATYQARRYRPQVDHALTDEWLSAPAPVHRPRAGDDDVTISVVIPSYRHAPFIGNAIRSVDRQTYPHIQLVIVDDGSPDDSVAVIEKTLGEIGITDVVFEKQANQGAAAAINRGVELSRGRFVSILNSDDVYHPERLQALYDEATENDAEFVFSEVFIAGDGLTANTFQEQNRRWLDQLASMPTLGFTLLQSNGVVSTSNLFFSRALFDRVGPFRDLVLVHDWDFVLRAVLDGEPRLVRRELLFYRIHESNTISSRNTLRRTIDEYRTVLRTYFRSVQSTTPRNPLAPSPQHFGDTFFEFLAKPGDAVMQHASFPSHESLWRSASIDVSAAQAAFTPPQKLMELVGSVDAEGFHSVGEEFLSYFIEYTDLEPDASVLDIGCGSGRLAIPLTTYLDENGSYTGFDIVPEAVEWCRSTITPQFPAFRFDVADVRNTFYNPDGPIPAHEYTFPYDDLSFDFVFLTSVFTHVLPAEFERYVSEISRTLRPGGRALATFFLDTDESDELMRAGKSTLDFRIRRDGYRTINAEHPEFAICFPKKDVLDVLARHGLAVTAIMNGSWCGRAHYTSYQDILILERVERPAVHTFEQGPGQPAPGSNSVQHVVVSHRPDIFGKYVAGNPNVPEDSLHLYDNTTENIGIATRYNDFIDNHMGDGWVVFMHHDLELTEPLQPRLADLKRDSIYGVVGTSMERQKRFVFLGLSRRRVPTLRTGRFSVVKVSGFIRCLEQLSPVGWTGTPVVGNPVVDTVDCCCVIVHSDLIRKHGLRFDPNFPWHLYSEKFSLEARRDHGVLTRVVQVKCGHYGLGEMDEVFRAGLRNLIDEFGEGWVSTCYQPPVTGDITQFQGRTGFIVQF